MRDSIRRAVLPIPDRAAVGLTASVEDDDHLITPEQRRRIAISRP